VLKASRFNHVWEYDGSALAFQGRTGVVVALDVDARGVLRRAEVEPVGPDVPWAAELGEAGFLVPETADEVAEVRETFERSRRDQTRAELVVAPTMECNLACSYCFEHGRNPVRMKPEVEEAVALAAQALCPEGGKLAVTWYGGEPLLALDTLVRLTACFQEVCSRVGARYVARIVTNGTLLHRKAALRLLDLGVTRAQVTLDGPELLHNSRRRFRTGSGSWQTIVANVMEVSSVLDVALRVTVGPGDARWLVPLCEELDRLGIPEGVSVYAAPLNEEAGCHQECGDSGHFFAQLACLGLWKRGHPRLRLPVPDPTDPCLGLSLCGLAVDPYGDIHRCLETVGDRRWAVGNVVEIAARCPGFESTAERLRQMLARSWSEANPFRTGSECCECRFLPQCLGGCPKAFLAGGRRQCTPWRTALLDWAEAVASADGGGDSETLKEGG